MNMNFLSPSTLRRTAVLAAAVALAGCATLGGTPEQIVAQRAGEYWKARQSGDYAKAYKLSTPSYRKLRTQEQFRLQFGAGVNVTSAEVAKVTCETQKCTAKMKIGAKPVLPGLKLDTIPMYMDEVWLLEDGQWWHFQEP
ncbi:hypothetical protein [Alicycliphilus denitrificans]|uniref:hypothetical protein n=1 Tax=Alicycliphilus denitrificans TaxID=179636 RepID=UPI000AB8BC25|nr:hypothetical protein [Alicycliphilus denitrificans]